MLIILRIETAPTPGKNGVVQQEFEVCRAVEQGDDQRLRAVRIIVSGRQGLHRNAARDDLVRAKHKVSAIGAVCKFDLDRRLAIVSRTYAGPFQRDVIETVAIVFLCVI